MNIEIENPFELLLELTYLNGCLNGKQLPKFINLNELMNKLKELKGG